MLKNEIIVSNKNKKTKSIDSENFNLFINNKVIYLQEIIKKTYLSANKYKVLDILSVNEVNLCTGNLELLFDKLNKILISISEDNIVKETILKNILDINDDLSGIIKSYGTENISVSYGVYSTDLEVGFSFALKSSSDIQQEE